MQLYACGSNGSSQLSLNHAEDVSILTRCIFHPTYEPPADAEILDLVSSSTHSLLLLGTSAGNVLLGAGTNTLGQLGPRCALWDEAKPEGRFKPVSLALSAGLQGDWEPVKIAATWTTSFVTYRRVIDRSSSGGSSGSQNDLASSSTGSACTAEEVIVGCGSNDFGELGTGGAGNGDRVAVTAASDNATVIPAGIRPGESVEMLRGGQRHVVAVLRGARGQRVVGWGASRKGELDPRSASRGVKAKGKTVSTVSPPTEIRVNTPDGVTIRDVALGASHTLVLLSDGTVRGWGSDLKGQITGIESMEDVSCIGATWGGSYCLTRQGEIFSQGSNTHGQLLRECDEAKRPGRVAVPEGPIEAVVAGSEHLLVVVNLDQRARELWAGGWNEHGNLGLGHANDQSRLVKVDVPGQIRRVWGGLAATWVWTAHEG